MLLAEAGFAKLRNNPLGDPMGKFGNVVGSKWKDGFYYIKSRVFPTQRGTIAGLRAFLAHTTRRFSYKQMNIRNTMRMLGFIGRMNLETWIDLVWGDYIIRHGITSLSGLNLMVKSNLGRLYKSIADIEKIWHETTNNPDLTKMLASKGDLEAPVAITSAIYTALTGDLTILFATQHYTNGADTDLAYAMVAKKPMLDTSEWEPKLFIYPPSRGNTKTRTDGTISLVLPASLTKTDLVAYLFFKDAAGTIGFSDSMGIQVT
jgi:hypothetical protein